MCSLAFQRENEERRGGARGWGRGCANGFGKVKGHLVFVETNVCVLTSADGWRGLLAYVCGHWAQMSVTLGANRKSV